MLFRQTPVTNTHWAKYIFWVLQQVAHAAVVGFTSRNRVSEMDELPTAYERHGTWQK
jgi:hypothetical protein